MRRVQGLDSRGWVSEDLCGKRTRYARSSGESSKLPEGGSPCPPPHHTSSSPWSSGDSPTCSRRGRRAILWSHPLEPSFGLPPPPYPREGGLREAGAGPAVRLRLREDSRRLLLLGEHPLWDHRDEWVGLGDRAAARDGARSLRPGHRPAELSELAMGCSTTGAPCGGDRAGKNPVERNHTTIRNILKSDLDAPHPAAEVAEVVEPAVAARLEEGCLYGLWS